MSPSTAASKPAPGAPRIPLQPWQPEYLEALLRERNTNPAPVGTPPSARTLVVAPRVMEILGAETLRRLARSIG